MKKLLLLMMATALFSLNNAIAVDINSRDDDEKIIVIGDNSSNGGTNHRTTLPIECLYYRSCQTFMINILVPMSNFEMTVESLDGSITETSQIEGEQGSHLVSMPLSTGSYIVSVRIADSFVVRGFLQL